MPKARRTRSSLALVPMDPSSASAAPTHLTSTPLLLPSEPVVALGEYVARGGGLALRAARDLGPGHVLDVLDAAGIRGRGGAQFPTARKWRSIHDAPPEDGDRFVVANGAEGEPGTFKDRLLLRTNPFQVLEGVAVAAEVTDARACFVAVKRSFHREVAVLRDAVRQLHEAGWLRVPIEIVEGPEEYLFGEEKALLEVIEGEDPLPRNLPPYQYGLYSASPNLGWSANLDRSTSGPSEPSANPTLVNNVETFAATTAALRIGAEAYRTQGTDGSPGTLLVTVSGDVERAGVIEVPYGVTLGEVIGHVGGDPKPGRTIRAVLSGVANPAMGPEMLALPLTHDAFAAAGVGLGAAGFVVFDDARSMAEVARSVAWFLHVESCAQCTPCKEGTGAMARALAPAAPGDVADLDQILRALQTVDANARCYLPTQARTVVASLIDRFPEDFGEQLPPEGGPSLIAKIVDIVDGVAVLDATQARKRPDWTYAETSVTIR